jgi:hypothetical protein
MAAEAAKKAAASETGRKSMQRAAAGAAGLAAKAGGARYGRWRGDRKQRELAHTMARQVHGQLSEAVFVGSERSHLVVWKDDVPLAAFPPVDGDLAERPELMHVTAEDRFDPPPAKRKRKS